MKLQDQCCTREQGERLVQLGVKPEATFWWMPANSSHHREYIQYGWHGNNIAPAYNGTELGEMLPKGDLTRVEWATVPVKKGSTCAWDAKYLNWNKFSSTEAECRASMLIHLLENNLITADQVNGQQ